MRIASAALLFLGLAMNAHPGYAVETKLTCSEVAATETKCKEYDAETAKCDAEVGVVVKQKVDAAKTAADECKKKNGMTYVLKCKKELAASAKAINTPKQVAGSPIEKELAAKPDSACAKSASLGAANMVCKGPKKVLEAMQRNCIKDTK
ncbi:MAG: hypothetical protein H7249_15550 [Chitinophagaceae bacterium]|nr:hypothetical protein [Oligoflexus sp.]